MTAAGGCSSARTPTIAPAGGPPGLARRKRSRRMVDASSLRMRPATEADLPAVLDLYAQPDLDDGRVLPLDQARAILARFASYPDYTLYVAEHGGRIVGSLALLVMDNI